MQQGTREANRKEYDSAVKARADKWVPACNGLEEPFTYRGQTYLYCFNPATHTHAYICLDTDTAMPAYWFPAS